MREHEQAQRRVARSVPAYLTAAATATAVGERARGTPARLSHRSLLYLQRGAGNAAVAQVVQRTAAGNCAGPGRCECTACGDEEERPGQSAAPSPVQRAEVTGAVQRDVRVSRSPEPGVVPDGYVVKHNLSRQSFTNDPAAVRKTLELFLFERNDSKALELFDNPSEFVGPVPQLSLPTQVCDLDSATCAKHRLEVIRVVQQEVKDLKYRMNRFKEDFERRANDTLHLLLNDSEEKINQEKERYGLQKKEGMFSWLTGADYSLNNAQELTGAAKALLDKYLVLKTATDAMTKCTGLGGTLPPGGVDAMCTAEDKARAETDVKEREKDYSILRKQKEGEHPILVTYDLNPEKEGTHGVLATLAADSGDAKAKLLYEHIAEKLDNIKTTREYALSHHDVVWKLPTVLGIAQKLPDIAGYEKLPDQGLQRIAIEDAKTHTVVVDLIQNAALAAITIGLGLITGPLGAAGMRGLALAATATDAGIGVAMMLKAIHQFEFEQAATNTDLDTKAKSISQEEPSLFWLALDIVMTVAQLKAAAAEFQGFVRLSRSATAAKVAKNEPEATKLLDDLQKKGNDLKPGVGDRLRREAEELGTSAAQDAGEIAGNLENVVPSSLGGYTHEIPMGGGKFWRRTAEGRWCFFASPPRCPLGVMDYMLAPWLSGLTPEASTALMNSRRVLKIAKADPRVGELLEKYGVDAVKAMEHAPFHGEDPLQLLQRFDRLNGKVKGAEQLLKDLAAGESTTRGAIGEISYIEMLLKDGYEIERVADWVNGKKAADIILKDNTVIDVKYYDWTHWRWQVPEEVRKSIKSMAAQVALRKQQYPKADIVYVFAGAKGDVPKALARALSRRGVTVKGTF